MNVRGRDVYVTQSLYGGSKQRGNDKRCRLLFFLGVASHGVFAEAANTVLGECDLERVVVTDTIPPLRVTDPRLNSKLRQVSAAPLLTEAIRRPHAGGSIVEWVGG